MKKVAVMVKSCEFDKDLGGMGRASVFNYNILKELGYEVHVVSPNLNLKKNKTESRGIQFYCCGGKAKTYNGVFYHTSKDIVEKIKPDFIVAHSGAGKGVIDLKIPKIFVSHGHGMQFTQTFLLEHYLIEKQKNFKETLIKKMDEIWGVSRNYLMKFDKCVFLTETSMREARDRFCIPQAVHVPLSVDEVDVGSVKKEYDVMICANALSLPYKGFKYAERAVKELGVSTIIIGAKGPQNANMRFTGHVNRVSDVYTYMKSAKVSLELSYHQSGLNMVKLESLYNGLPVIGWNIGSSYETIEDDDSGYIVPFQNMYVLKDRILKALDDYKRLGNNSKCLYNKKFSNKVYKKNWKEMIESIL